MEENGETETLDTGLWSGQLLFKQFGYVLLFMLKMKAWRFLLALIPIVALVSNRFIPPFITAVFFSNKNVRSHFLDFYTAADFTASGRRVLMQKSSCPEVAQALTNRMAIKGGTMDSDWLMDCASESDCTAKYIRESDDRTIGYIKCTKSSPAVLECFNKQGLDLPCAFLYQLMSQSLAQGLSNNAMFKDVTFFMQRDKSSLSELQLQRMTYIEQSIGSLPNSICAEWISKGTFGSLLPVVLMFQLMLVTMFIGLYFSITTVSCIYHIKANGFIRNLFQNGLSVAVYWSAIWTITILECLIFSSIFVLSYTTQCPGVFPAVKMANVFFAFLFFCLSLAAVAKLIVTTEKSIYIASIVMFCLNSLIFMMMLTDVSSKLVNQGASYYLLFLFPPANLLFYASSMMTSAYAMSQVGVDYTTLKPAYFAAVPPLMAVTVAVLILVTTYLDFWLPSGNGLRLPPTFPFHSSFWFVTKKEGQGDSVPLVDEESEAHIEPVVGLSPSVIVDRVCMAYPKYFCMCNGPDVLHGLSCKIYKDQITALIGHNGAGKSTLIKILTGEESPTDGAAFVSGCEVTDPLKRLALRGQISVCPQFDILCSVLTVMECIRVVMVSRGIMSENEENRARNLLQRLGLSGKEDVKCTDLSGGQKRKVSTILALLGNPDVVFLDEPTSGLDPVSRRQLWQVLQEEKANRSIILCTQFMDEADILADRKIFLCGGEIVCAGSSLFLKREFGCSSILNVSLKSENDVTNLMGMLKHVRLKSQFKTELQLEVAASKPDALADAVQVLETQSRLVSAFGLSQATLDEIFMRLSGVSSSDIKNAFSSGGLISFLENAESTTGAEQHQSAAPSSTESMRASIFTQFCALLSTNLKRQFRSTSNSRLMNSVFCLAIIGYLSYNASGSTGTTKHVTEVWNNSTQPKLEDSSKTVRSWDFQGFQALTKICIYDDTATTSRADSADLCKRLSLPVDEPVLLRKDQSTSLQNFLIANSTMQQLRVECGKIALPCVIYYSSSWALTEANKNRAVTIGAFATENVPPASFVHIYRNAFSSVAHIFNAGESLNTPRLSHVKPVSAFFESRYEMFIFYVSLGVCAVTFIGDPVEDMSSGVRKYLASMGMSKLAYWINTFVLHWIQYAIYFMIALALLAQVEQYRSAYFIFAASFPVLLLGTTSNQLTAYVVAILTARPSVTVEMLGDVMATLQGIVSLLIMIYAKHIALPFIWLVPPMAPVALMYYSIRLSAHRIRYYEVDYAKDVTNLYGDYWSDLYIMCALFAMVVHILLMISFIAMLENKQFIYAICCRCFSSESQSDDSDASSSADPGVVQEASRVLEATQNAQNVLEVRQLTKTYPNGVKAVRGVTFGAMAGEILGLLGSNGAGKTTSMSVVVGEESATDGVSEVRFGNTWMSVGMGAGVGATGYCPQHNPLFDNITVTEHLQLYARIRGVPDDSVNTRIQDLMQGLGLLQHEEKMAKVLSGGNKRRLCLAISLLGNPSLIVIDEASTGVDPENKRFIWSAIRGMVHEQRSVLVTTHSMEEVEALCNRVGIMNKGRMIAFGTVQQLRSHYGDAYTLDVSLQQDSDEALIRKKSNIRSAIASQFQDATVLEELSLCIQFSMPTRSVSSLSAALRWLSKNQTALSMHYFALYQMSLDQVFVELIRQQYVSSTDV